VHERDEWRGKDSFETFEEVFTLARREKVDLVLLCGDLFHENKPSRATLIRCLDILNRHCLGDDPIAFQAPARSHRTPRVASPPRAGSHPTPPLRRS